MNTLRSNRLARSRICTSKYLSLSPFLSNIWILLSRVNTSVLHGVFPWLRCVFKRRTQATFLILVTSTRQRNMQTHSWIFRRRWSEYIFFDCAAQICRIPLSLLEIYAQSWSLLKDFLAVPNYFHGRIRSGHERPDFPFSRIKGNES